MHSISTPTVQPKSVILSPSPSQDAASLAAKGGVPAIGVSPRVQLVGHMAPTNADTFSTKLSFKFGGTTTSTVADLLALNPMRPPHRPPPRFMGSTASITTSTAQAATAQKTSVSKPTSKRCGIYRGGLDCEVDEHGIDSADNIKKQQEYYVALHAARAQLAEKLQAAVRALHKKRIHKQGASRKRITIHRRGDICGVRSASGSVVANIEGAESAGEGKIEENVDGLWSEESNAREGCHTTDANCANWQGNATGYFSPVSTGEDDGTGAAGTTAGRQTNTN